MKPRYINTLNLNSLFFLKQRTMTHYKNLCTIVSMFYLSQSFGYQSRSVSSYLCMLSLLHLNYVESDHDTDSLRTDFSIATSVLTSKQHPHFSHNDFSLSIRITFEHSLSEQIHNSFIHIAISLPLFSLL